MRCLKVGQAIVSKIFEILHKPVKYRFKIYNGGKLNPEGLKYKCLGNDDERSFLKNSISKMIWNI